MLRNYEGYITTYEEPPTYNRHDESACSYCQTQRSEPGQSGVLGLLEGERMWIEPQGFSETHSRGNTEAHRLQDPSKWVPFGVGAIEGQASRPLRVLEGGEGSAAVRRRRAGVGPGAAAPGAAAPSRLATRRRTGANGRVRPRRGTPPARRRADRLGPRRAPLGPSVPPADLPPAERCRALHAPE